MNRREETLKAEMIKLDKIISDPVNADRIENIRADLRNKNIELEELTDIKLNGQILRSKANMVEYSEKNSKYVASLEKKRSESKLISRLQINNNKINTDQTEILSETEKFYKTLYAKRETRNSRYNFFDESITKLNQAECWRYLCRLITMRRYNN